MNNVTTNSCLSELEQTEIVDVMACHRSSRWGFRVNLWDLRRVGISGAGDVAGWSGVALGKGLGVDGGWRGGCTVGEFVAVAVGPPGGWASLEVVTRCVRLRLIGPLCVSTMKERGLWCFLMTSPDFFMSLTKTVSPGLRGVASLAAWRRLKRIHCFCFLPSSFSRIREWSGSLGEDWRGQWGFFFFSFLPIRSSLGDFPLCNGLALYRRRAL